MTVTIELLTSKNWRDAQGIEVTEEQRRFLTTPDLAEFLAADRFHPTFRSLGVYDSGRIVGFVSVGHEAGDPTRWWVPLLVIDRRHQRRGYGRAAMLAVIERARTRPSVVAIGLAYHPENLAAAMLYRSLGFVPTGTRDGEIEAWLSLTGSR